ncbi:rhodanese family protein [Polymorphobacter sp.]|uniref:rhodanese family protein n=1 Tax=Polymorphobacter sp. TaxID=1909290 RepID=UPI003F71E836
MTLIPITPKEARARLDAGQACLIDIRGADEFARGHVAGARLLPADMITAEALPGDGRSLIFTCRTGMRTAANAARLAALAPGAMVLEGGLDGWRKAGLPVVENRAAPLEIMRQVQIAAGLLILAGVILGFLVAPGWFALAGFVGAGLTFAGLTGFCGMARLLALMPWNKTARA